MFSLFFTVLLAFADQSYGPEPIPEELGKSPHSPYWTADPESKLKEIFKKLYEVSGYKESIDLEYRANERLLDGYPIFVRFPGADEIGPPKIFLGYSIFEISKSEDELAHFLSHEISHVLLDHGKRKREFMEKFSLGKWYNKNKKRLDRIIKNMESGGQSAVKIVESIDLLYLQEVVFPFLRKQEEEADIEGASLAFLAGFKPEGAFSRIIHQAEYGWALQSCKTLEECWAKQSFKHGSDAERHDRLKQILKDLKIIEE